MCKLILAGTFCLHTIKALLLDYKGTVKNLISAGERAPGILVYEEDLLMHIEKTSEPLFHPYTAAPHLSEMS